MGRSFRGLAVVVALGLVFFSGAMSGQSPAFNPRDVSGVWWVGDPGTEKLLARGRTGDARRCQTCHIPEHTLPEPPLTAWAREHLIATTGMPHRSTCDPIGVPAQFWYTQLAPFEFVVTPERIVQFFESHREWRTIWMNRDHPDDLKPSYMGHSVGTWVADTLVVDTVGFNGKAVIEPVGVDHLMSDAFHLTERWRRVSHNRVELDVTYSDPKVWGDRSWGGLKKTFVLQPDTPLIESYCSAEDNTKFDEKFLHR